MFKSIAAKFLSAAFLLSAFFAFTAAGRPNTIPSLREWTDGSGVFTISSGSRICVAPAFADSLTRKVNVTTVFNNNADNLRCVIWRYKCRQLLA